MNKPIRCAVIGQKPMRFPWGFDRRYVLFQNEDGIGAADHGAATERRVAIPRGL